MYRLARRPPFTRSLPSSHIIRQSSTDSSKDQSNPATPPKARIAITWGDVSIPSSKEVKQNANRHAFGTTGETYKPDLRYLNKPGQDSVASRLLETAPPKSAPVKPSVSTAPSLQTTPPANSPVRSTPARPAVQVANVHVPPVDFVDPTITLRRKERQARETRLAQAREARLAQAAKASTPPVDFVDPTITQRRKEREAREAGLTAKGAPSERSSAPSTFTKTATVQNTRSILMVDDDVSQEDAAFYIPDEAALQGPDAPSADLTDVFAPTIKLRPLSKRNARQQAEERINWALKAFGGNYAQYAPEDGKDHTRTPKDLGAIHYAKLTLAHRAGISLEQRQSTADVIRFALGETSAIPEQDARA